jgi:transposase-like protein
MKNFPVRFYKLGRLFKDRRLIRKVGGKSAWIFTAIDPLTWRIIYLEPFFKRDEHTTTEFLEHLAKAYGSWPKEMITDGGSWYRAAVPFWSWKKFLWRVVRGGLRSSIEGFFGEFLKRRMKDFDCYVPTNLGLRSLSNWTGSWVMPGSTIGFLRVV